MKKIIFSLLVLFAFTTMQAQITNSNPNVDIPAQINTFLNKHFNGISVVKYKKETERKGMEYKIYLNDFTKLKFNTQFEMIEIESETRLPENVIPSKVASYVKANYPDFFYH